MTPFNNSISGGPSITPATANAAGRGGQQNPAYLQMRRPTSPVQGLMPPNPNPTMKPTQPTAPVITPAPGVQGDTVSAQPNNAYVNHSLPSATGGPSISPPPNSGNPPQAGGNTLADQYKFYASDLANKTTQAKSNAVADASARGVYYGTPLTGSEADIDTQYLRGMGQLQAGMYGNEQQNQLARLALASGLSAQGAMNQPPAPAPMDFSGLGALFGSGNNTQPSISSTPRSGPVGNNGPQITPAGDSKKLPPTNGVWS